MEPPERPADPAVRRAYLRRIAALFRPYPPGSPACSALIVLSSALGVDPGRSCSSVCSRRSSAKDTRSLSINAAAR